MLPTSASNHYRALQRLQAVTVSSVRRAWRRMQPGGNWEDQYRSDVGPKIAVVVVAAQVAATREADSYVANVLNELDLGPPTQRGVVVPTSLAGVAGDGRPVSSLLEGAVVRAGQALQAPQVTPEQALADAEAWIDMVAQTLIADANRAAESVAITTRPWVDGYVRMLNPPSCSRCVVLAGRFYLFNEGFERHPRCDCLHIPAPEADYKDLTVNPDRYFRSLSRAEQDKAFTKAGAEAIRDGADISQVVNARRGMKQAQVFGRDVLVTDEGTTRRGLAYRRLTQGRETDRRRKGERNFRAVRVRLMPEAIYQIAGDDRDEAVRLLTLHGYIT